MCAQYRITLTQEEVDALQAYGFKGFRNAKLVLWARALLLLDKGTFTKEHWDLETTSKALGLSKRTLNKLKQRFVCEGFDALFHPKPSGRSKRPVIFDGSFEAHLVQLACQDPPEGHARWTVRLLADKLVELKIVPKVSTMTVQRALKKTNLNLT